MKFKSLLYFLAVSIFVLFCVSSYAATINVPDDQATITLALAAATSGDIITVDAGTYNESITISKSLTILGSGIGNTIISGDGIQSYVVTIDADNTTINGFTLQMSSVGGSDYIVKIFASNVIVSNNIIKGDGGSVETGISTSSSNSNIIISGNTVSNCSYSTIAMGAFNSTISANTVFGSTSAGGIEIYSNSNGNVSIYNNIIYDFPNTAGIQISTEIGSTPDNNNIYNNTIYSCAGGISVSSNNNYVYNNLIYDITGTETGGGPPGFGILIISEDNPCSGNIVVNNTIDNIQHDDENVGLGILALGKDGGELSNTTISNNIVSSSEIGIAKAEAGGTVAGTISDYNCVYSNATQYNGITKGSNDITTDPLFSNVSNNDFRLQATSPCIDAGTTTNAPSSDSNSNTRGTIPDMGAFEYFEFTGSSTWYKGHCNIGVIVPGTTWYFAEGSTQGSFDTWILLSNPNGSSADVVVTFYNSNGTTVVKNITMPKNSRDSINVNIVAGMTDRGFSTKVTSDLPIMAERAMYWDTDERDWDGSHCSGGIASTSKEWYFAEGSTQGFSCWLLLVNAESTAANVTLTFYKDDDSVSQVLVTVPATSRYSANLNDYFGDQAFSIKVTSPSVPIVAERAMY